MSDQRITVPAGALQFSQGQVEAWTRVSFAQSWLRDAVMESKQEGPNHRRKEIVFAVCFAESYLFEVVRDLILDDFRESIRYFPAGRKLGIKDRCKVVFAELHEHHKIKNAIKWDPFWPEFCRLVDMRDGLVHASISRPDSASLPRKSKPTPSSEDFYGLSQGWALQRALDLVRAMHDAMGGGVPQWITDPDLLLQH